MTRIKPAPHANHTSVHPSPETGSYLADDCEPTSAGLDWARVPFFMSNFTHIDSCSIETLERAAHRRTYAAGSAIFNEGDSCAGLHIVTEGLIRLYRTNTEGRLHTLSLLRSPSTFNEVAAVDGGVNPFNAVAVTQAAVRVIGHEPLLGLMSDHPGLMSSVAQALARLNRETLERLEDMTFRTIPSRLAKLFLHETTYGDQISETPTGLTQEEMAAILGTAREVVGRALRNLLNAGLLRRSGRGLTIADREGLEYLAETNLMPSSALTPQCTIMD